MLKKTFFMKQLFYFHFIKKNELSDTIKESLFAFQRNKNIRCR